MKIEFQKSADVGFAANLTRKNMASYYTTQPEVLRNGKHLAQLKKLKGAFTGLIGDEQSIQRMKADRAESLRKQEITSPHTTPSDQP